MGWEDLIWRISDEKIGLLPEPPRTQGGHRVYEDTHTKTLRFIRRSRELGFPIEDIRSLLSMVDGGQGCEAVKAIALRQAKTMRSKIDDLQRMRRLLMDTAAQCAGGGTPDCPIIDVLFDAPPSHAITSAR
ncbi:MAG: MerR family DNA-binding protein [Alphaproteobacteria bacterium]|nr:MerR family DNA-binding protein [Alphaproteobacteria bacterium]